MNTHENPQLMPYFVIKIEFFPRSETREGCHFMSCLFNIVRKLLTGAVRQENKRHPGWKRNKKNLFADYMIL